MTSSMTETWYTQSGWAIFNEWLTELRSKGLKKIYGDNLEFLPDGIDKEALIKAFAADSDEWELQFEDDDLIAVIKKRTTFRNDCNGGN